MGARSILCSVLGLLLVVNLVTAHEWDFEFGQKFPSAFPVFKKEGTIPLFSYKNYIKIVVPLEVELTRVRVTVWSLSPPKVDVNWTTDTVEILYSWTQVTLSTYKIQADGVTFYPRVGENHPME